MNGSTILSFVLTFVLSIYILYEYYREKQIFDKYIDEFKDSLTYSDLIEVLWSFRSNEILAQLGEKYKSTFSEINKTEYRSVQFFTVDNLSTTTFNLPKIEGFHSRLIGLGISFTFIGLTVGVLDLGLKLMFSGDDQTEAITQGINTLLGGMGAAFITSIFGMLSSIFFSNNYKNKLNELNILLQKLCFDLDLKYLKSNEDLESEKEARLIKIIDNYSRRREDINSQMLEDLELKMKIDNGNEVGLGNLAFQLLNESKRQTDAMTSFSTELADVIYERDGNSIAEILRKGFESMERINQNPVENLVDRLLDELQKTFDKLSFDLKETIEKMLVSIKNDTGNEIISKAEQATQEMDNVLVLLKDLPETFRNLNSTTETTRTLTSEMLESIRDIIKEQHVLIKEQKEASEIAKTTIEIYADTRSQMNLSLENIKITNRELAKSIKEYQAENLNYLVRREEIEVQSSETVKSVADMLLKSSDLQVSMAKGVDNIKEDLGVIFDHINAGLEGYHSTINNNINTEIKTYAEVMNKAIGGLQSAISDLEDKLGDLEDVLSIQN